MSEWKHGAAKRRDARRGGAIVERPTLPAKKDRKRWCRGKAGVEHKLECRNYKDTKLGREWTSDWRLLVCTGCGKELDWWYPSRWNKRNKPEWVTG